MSLGEQCQKASQKGTLPYLMKRLCKPDLIILDEIGYFDFDEVIANLFFKSFLSGMRMEL